MQKKKGRPTKGDKAKNKLINIRVSDDDLIDLDDLGLKISDSPTRTGTILEALKRLKFSLQFNLNENQLNVNYKTKTYQCTKSQHPAKLSTTIGMMTIF